nr:uncharacterized protein LOC105346258 [Crassostrea gigas]
MDASKFIRIGLVLTICAFIFQLIGLASPYWTFAESEGYKGYLGLWKFCIYSKVLDTSKCTDWPLIPDWLEAVRATSILGSLLVLAAIVMLILRMFVMQDRNPVLFAAIGTTFVGAISILISIAVYASKGDELSKEDAVIQGASADYHFAFAFCILAMLAALGAGAIMMIEVVKA